MARTISSKAFITERKIYKRHLSYGGPYLPRQNLLFHGKTYFLTAKLTFPQQNLCFHGKTYFFTAELHKGLGRDLFLNRLKMATAYSDNEDGVEDNTEEVLIKLKYYFYRGYQYKDILDFLLPPYRPPCWIDCS